MQIRYLLVFVLLLVSLPLFSKTIPYQLKLSKAHMRIQRNRLRRQQVHARLDRAVAEVTNMTPAQRDLGESIMNLVGLTDEQMSRITQIVAQSALFGDEINLDGVLSAEQIEQSMQLFQQSQNHA